jgi:hypothetical protein
VADERGSSVPKADVIAKIGSNLDQVVQKRIAAKRQELASAKTNVLELLRSSDADVDIRAEMFDQHRTDGSVTLAALRELTREGKLMIDSEFRYRLV